MHKLLSIIRLLQPYFLIENLKRRQQLIKHGLKPRWSDFFKYGKWVTSLSISNLDLFPPNSLLSLNTVIDVGANTGLWSSHVLACIKPNTMIVYEPIPRVFNALVEKLKPYKVADVRALVIGSEQKEVLLTLLLILLEGQC